MPQVACSVELSMVAAGIINVGDANNRHHSHRMLLAASDALWLSRFSPFLSARLLRLLRVTYHSPIMCTTTLRTPHPSCVQPHSALRTHHVYNHTPHSPPIKCTTTLRTPHLSLCSVNHAAGLSTMCSFTRCCLSCSLNSDGSRYYP